MDVNIFVINYLQ